MKKHRIADINRGSPGYQSPSAARSREGGNPLGIRAPPRPLPAQDLFGGRPLDPGWGLATLVDIGEAWLPAMLERDASEGREGSDEHVTRLFEFVVSAICL